MRVLSLFIFERVLKKTFLLRESFALTLQLMVHIKINES